MNERISTPLNRERRRCSPNYIAQEVLDRFERECGVEVILDTDDSNESLLARPQDGATGYDVIVPLDYVVSKSRRARWPS
ncbi:MAG: hypothetical protein J7452_00240 [Thermoflexus sp.]|nr:hypothetical protein [Thermoflexus sp.]